MNIAGTTYSLKNRALDLFISGCMAPHCSGCHNPYAWDYKAGSPLVYSRLKRKIDESLSMIDQIRVMGGEPLDRSAEEITCFLQWLSDNYPKQKIVLFTRYEEHEVKEKIPSVLRLCDYVKFGSYKENLPPRYEQNLNIILASSNQMVVEGHRSICQF